MDLTITIVSVIVGRILQLDSSISNANACLSLEADCE